MPPASWRRLLTKPACPGDRGEHLLLVRRTPGAHHICIARGSPDYSFPVGAPVRFGIRAGHVAARSASMSLTATTSARPNTLVRPALLSCPIMPTPTYPDANAHHSSLSCRWFEHIWTIIPLPPADADADSVGSSSCSRRLREPDTCACVKSQSCLSRDHETLENRNGLALGYGSQLPPIHRLAKRMLRDGPCHDAGATCSF